MVNRTKLLDALLSVDNTYPGGWASAKMIQRMAGFSRSCFWNACRNERDIIEIGPHPDGANLKLYRIKPRARKAARARCH